MRICTTQQHKPPGRFTKLRTFVQADRSWRLHQLRSIKRTCYFNPSRNEPTSNSSKNHIFIFAQDLRLFFLHFDSFSLDKFARFSHSSSLAQRFFLSNATIHTHRGERHEDAILARQIFKFAELCDNSATHGDDPTRSARAWCSWRWVIYFSDTSGESDRAAAQPNSTCPSTEIEKVN